MKNALLTRGIDEEKNEKLKEWFEQTSFIIGRKAES